MMKDVWTLADLLGITGEHSAMPEQNTGGLPIAMPQGFDWEKRKDPTRFTKMFKFTEESKFNAFVMDLLELQSETGHHGRVTLQYPQVKIEVWTHSLNDVTEIDVEWGMKVDDIYGDHQ